jgi:Na+-transporting methylmalonyl-CoA/oxaloacetate decarboxylase gamma subunit
MAMLSIMAVLIILAMIIRFMPSVSRPASMFQPVLVSQTDKYNYSNHQKSSSKAQIAA